MEDKSDLIDFSALEKELQRAVEADRKYRRENDAKFRAVHQKVATYEEFRDIVQASHLKPLEKKDKNSPRRQPWNPVSTAQTDPNLSSTDSLQAVPCESLPRGASDLSRDWRRLEGRSEEKYALLLRLGGENLREMFHTEVGLGLLGDFLTVLCECFRPGDEAGVISVLQGLSLTGRFGLGVSLLSDQERGACRRLFSSLMENRSSLAGVPRVPRSQKECERQTEENTERKEWTEAGEMISDLMGKFGVGENPNSMFRST